jgi:hypothetical protein
MGFVPGKKKVAMDVKPAVEAVRKAHSYGVMDEQYGKMRDHIWKRRY